MPELTETERIAIILQLKNDEFEKRAKSSAKAISRLEARYDPLTKAANRYKAEQAQVNRALERGTIDAVKHKKMMALVKAEYDQTTTRIKATKDAVLQMNSATSAQMGFVRRNGHVFQQAGYQVQDFFVQVQGGTSAVTAFTQQAPQFLGIFGAWGSIMGAAIAVGVPLGAMLYNLSGASEDTKEKTQSLADAIRDYSSAVADARLPTEELEKKYGSASEAARVFAIALIELKRAAALEKLGKAQIVDEMDVERLRSVLDILDGVAEDTRAFSSNYSAALRELADDFGATEDQARTLLDALDAWENADGPNEAVAAGEQLLDTIVAIYGPLDELTGSAKALADKVAVGGENAAKLQGTIENANATLIEFVANAFEAGGALASTLPNADALLVRMQAIAGAARDYVRALGASAVKGGRGSDPTTMGGSLKDWNDPENRLIVNPGEGVNYGPGYRPPKTRKGGSGEKGRTAGSLFSVSQEELAKLQRQIDLLGKSKSAVAAAMVKHKLLAEAKRRGMEVTDDLLARIDAEAAGVGKLADQYDRARDKISALERINVSLKDTVLDAAMGGADAFDQFKDSIKRAALEYALFGTGMFAGGGNSGGGSSGLFGTVLSGISSLFSADGGGYTGNRPRTGGIDGKGGFIGVYHPQETITDHSKGQSFDSGGSTQQVELIIHAAEGVTVETVRSEIKVGIRNAGPELVETSVGATLERMQATKGGWA